MAKTKRKRRTTKHRGNAAGMVEQRGRTSKPASTKKSDAPKRARSQRPNKAPTWQGSVTKAAVPALIFAVTMLFLFKKPISQAAVSTAFVFLLYVPVTYYTDRFVYNRRKRQLSDNK